jgi:hypothetical protein
VSGNISATANHHLWSLADDPACRLQVTFVLNLLSVAGSDHYRETSCNSIFALFIILHALRLLFLIICHPVSSLSLSLSSSGSASFLFSTTSSFVSQFIHLLSCSCCHSLSITHTDIHTACQFARSPSLNIVLVARNYMFENNLTQRTTKGCM